MPVERLLLVALVVLAVLILVLVLTLRRSIVERETVDDDRLSAALGQSWRSLGFDETLGRLEQQATEMRTLHDDIESMLRVPQVRGAFGETQLDAILADHLPPDRYGLREQVVDGKTPDAYVDTPQGKVCIDAKFPLENYQAAREAETDEERARYERAFADDVASHLEKIAADYVRPAAGTTEFAFAFIPSEGVYYHLVTEEYDLLRASTHEGVQVVSPLTLGHKLELISAGVQARALTERAEAVRDHLERLGERFEAVSDEWETLRRHVRNAHNKADDVDAAYGRLRDAFDRVEEPAVDAE